MTSATLHLLCGKIASGKSTLAHQLVRQHGAVLVAEDDWTAALWPGELTSLETYLDRTNRLHRVLGPHVAGILRAGVSVVLDAPANTRAQRARLAGIIAASGADHVLHWLDLPDETCKARLRARNAGGAHAYVVSEAQFDRFTAHFEAPGKDEGLTVNRIIPAD